MYTVFELIYKWKTLVKRKQKYEQEEFTSIKASNESHLWKVNF